MTEPDAKMSEAVVFFEQMLQSMPGDRTSLEFLAVAYEQMGERDKRRDCLITLADTLLREKDYDNAQIIAEHLSVFKDVPAAQIAVQRVKEVVQGAILKQRDIKSRVDRTVTQPTVAGAELDTSIEMHALSRSASTAEMDLVWFWIERGFAAKELCMDVLHVLTDRPVAQTTALISALAILNDQHPEVTDRMMEAMQRVSDMPVIPLELFDVVPTITGLLSASFIRIKGALPFALMGDTVLVAVLNPMNIALQEEIVARIGRPCHFFFVHPHAWQQAVLKIV